MTAAFTFRRLLPADAAGVTSLVVRVYGTTYLRAELYSPDDIVRRNQAGEWISAVAHDDTGAIVGHAALELAPHGPVAELTMGMVLPQHQRHGILEGLRDFLIEEAHRRDLQGQFVEMGTDNLAAQAAANRSPARPFGLTLGLWPAVVRVAGRVEPPSTARVSFVRYFRYLQKPSRVVLHVPSHHHDMLGRIYAQHGVALEMGAEAALEGDGELSVERCPEWQSVFLTVRRVGADTPSQLDAAARAFHSDPGLESAYLELPMEQPGAAAACLHAEGLGFFFSGVSPFVAGGGDALRLQLLARDPELGRLRVTHPFAQELLAYVATERERRRKTT